METIFLIVLALAALWLTAAVLSGVFEMLG
jgi:hypothetical protein